MMLSQQRQMSRGLLFGFPCVPSTVFRHDLPSNKKRFFLIFRRATCFGGGDEDDYDQEAGGKVESDRKYRKVGSSSIVCHCMSSVHEANLSAKLVVISCSVHFCSHVWFQKLET